MALLTQEKHVNFAELDPDYEFDFTDLDEILRAPGMIAAHERMLKVKREHEIVIEEAMRLLSIYLTINIGATNYYETLVRYIFNYGYNHKSERIRRISIWSIGKLGLLSSLKPIAKQAQKIVEQGLNDARRPVEKMARKVLQKGFA